VLITLTISLVLVQYVFETLPTLNDDDLNTLLPWLWKETLPA
jgi:transposase